MNLSLAKFYDCKCELGEGLCLSYFGVAWVDILANKIFYLEGDNLKVLPTKTTPSVIFCVTEKFIEFGSEVGICRINKSSGVEQLLFPAPPEITHAYRSNDGCKIGAQYFLGFMHNENPEKNTGFIYAINDGFWHLLDDNIHIPNTFVDLLDGGLLISDSHRRETYRLNYDNLELGGMTLTHTIWHKFQGGAPDGGCRIGDQIAIALWDGGCIEVLNRHGATLRRLPLPVTRPTNCKFNPAMNQLWVTSASMGLDAENMSVSPDSGGTFVFNFSE